MSTLVIWLLRIGLIVLLLVSVLAQVAVVALAADFGRRTPEVAHLVAPYSVAAVLFIGCGQVQLVVVLRLLSMIRRGTIFTGRSLRWVDVIIACGALATVLAAAVVVHVHRFAPGHGGPSIFYLAACVVAGAMFVLLMIVMRGLLRTAIADRTELDEVI
jgi:hypothetical protein